MFMEDCSLLRAQQLIKQFSFSGIDFIKFFFVCKNNALLMHESHIFFCL